MDQSERNPQVIPMWSELNQDLLRVVFGRLSFTNLKRAKSVCRSWNSASKSCVPKRNQIPWLILFPPQNQTNINSCFLFVPDDKDNLYKTRDLGSNFRQSCCLASYGSWLLMVDHFRSLYIINPLSLKRIILPRYSSLSRKLKPDIRSCLACLWVDNITKKYLVVWILHDGMVYTRKGDGRWRTVSIGPFRDAEQIVYNCKDHKVYVTKASSRGVSVWDFSDDIPRQHGSLLPFDVTTYAVFDDDGTVDLYKGFKFRKMIATTVSGQVLLVACLVQDSMWLFHIYAYNPMTTTWEKVDDLGDEALILDMGFTVVAKDIHGMKRNSIYFSGINYYDYRKDLDHIFVYDLDTQTTEHLPQCLVSSVCFFDARWFFP